MFFHLNFILKDYFNLSILTSHLIIILFLAVDDNTKLLANHIYFVNFANKFYINLFPKQAANFIYLNNIKLTIYGYFKNC